MRDLQRLHIYGAIIWKVRIYHLSIFVILNRSSLMFFNACHSYDYCSFYLKV